MKNPNIVPCLWFDDQAEQAARFYAETFPGGRITATSRYPQSGDNPSGKPPSSVLTVELEAGGLHFTALNGGPQFVVNPSISFFVNVPTADEADRIFLALAGDGEVLMPLGSYPWSPRYGWAKDRFGVSWQVNTAPRQRASIVPCLMFAGPQHGKAEEAMRTYASIFPRSEVRSVERYAAGEGPVGTVKHGRFVLRGQELTAMDSHVSHDITFNEAVSLQVMCSDQSEIDRYWEALSDGGEQGPCGWLKDRFGLSWQVVPTDIAEWLASEDVAARDRAFQAMLTMGKLDIAALQAAFEG